MEEDRQYQLSQRIAASEHTRRLQQRQLERETAQYNMQMRDWKRAHPEIIDAAPEGISGGCTFAGEDTEARERTQRQKDAFSYDVETDIARRDEERRRSREEKAADDRRALELAEYIR